MLETFFHVNVVWAVVLRLFIPFWYGIQVFQFVALAITLNSASSKFRNDIIKVIIVTYRLKGQLLESGNKTGIAYFETSKFRWHASDGYQRSYSVRYPPVLGVWFHCFKNGTCCFLRVHFLSPSGGSPYLVLLGAGPTVLGHNLQKYESLAKLSGRPPTVKVISHNFRNRSPSNNNSKSK